MQDLTTLCTGSRQCDFLQSKFNLDRQYEVLIKSDLIVVEKNINKIIRLRTCSTTKQWCRNSSMSKFKLVVIVTLIVMRDPPPHPRKITPETVCEFNWGKLGKVKI